MERKRGKKKKRKRKERWILGRLEGEGKKGRREERKEKEVWIDSCVISTPSLLFLCFFHIQPSMALKSFKVYSVGKNWGPSLEGTGASRSCFYLWDFSEGINLLSYIRNIINIVWPSILVFSIVHVKLSLVILYTRIYIYIYFFFLELLLAPCIAWAYS